MKTSDWTRLAYLLATNPVALAQFLDPKTRMDAINQLRIDSGGKLDEDVTIRDEIDLDSFDLLANKNLRTAAERIIRIVRERQG